MLDGIQPYLDEGEKIYVGKLDSLKAFTGKNRIKIEGKPNRTSVRRNTPDR